jgi:hypothetical protein
VNLWGTTDKWRNAPPVPIDQIEWRQACLYIKRRGDIPGVTHQAYYRLVWEEGTTDKHR